MFCIAMNVRDFWRQRSTLPIQVSVKDTRNAQTRAISGEVECADHPIIPARSTLACEPCHTGGAGRAVDSTAGSRCSASGGHVWPAGLRASHPCSGRVSSRSRSCAAGDGLRRLAALANGRRDDGSQGCVYQSGGDSTLAAFREVGYRFRAVRNGGPHLVRRHL